MVQSRKVYTEAYVILEKLKLLEQLPVEVKELLENNYDSNIEFEYDDSLSIEYQNLDKETKIFLSYLYVKYFCESLDEKKQYKSIIVENSTKEELEKKEKYDSQEIFSSNDYIQDNQRNEELLCVNKEKWYKKLFDKIKEFLHFNKK